MKIQRKVSIPPDVEELGRRLEQWRETRQKHGPMPKELWDEAIALAEKYGVYCTARDLPVDFGGLKRRYVRAAETRSSTALEARETTSLEAPSAASSEAHRFVEVDAAQVMELQGSQQVSVELSAPDGARMTVRLEGGTGVDMVGLAGAFWRRVS